jgi:hypothetical protein
MAAVAALGKHDNDGQITGSANGAGGRPYGCTWHHFGNVEMWGKDHGAHCGSYSYQCVCMVPSNTRYVLKSSGTCAPHKRILDNNECMRAAFALGKHDNNGAISGDPNGVGGRPYGCTWHHFGNVEMWGKDKGASCGSYSYQCICKA